MKEEIDEFMRKLLKNYDMFKKTPKEDIAHDMEVQFSFLRVLLGNGFTFALSQEPKRKWLNSLTKSKRQKRRG